MTSRPTISAKQTRPTTTKTYYVSFGVVEYAATSRKAMAESETGNERRWQCALQEKKRVEGLKAEMWSLREFEAIFHS